ncbi:MAG: translation elongation factor 4 [Pseudomonadota bacterium]|nr:translation elongation factor 4 [Pseudomonadota bacterium]
MDAKLIRNFSIIAHIDHGKSTLADALLSETGALEARQEKEQFLDNMDIERERGITIKAQTVSLKFKAKDGITYLLNLIDTPGHVDFSYEVSRSLAACEGAVLVVDATQGVEAQTLANVYLALNNNLEVIPVVNKIDLPSADPTAVLEQIRNVIGLDTTNALLVSAKERIGVREILERVVEKVPPPTNDDTGFLRALIFDSWYDSYQGVIILVRVKEGKVKIGDKIRMMFSGTDHEVLKLGVFSPFPEDRQELGPGEVGFVASGIKTIRDVTVGDTITLTKTPSLIPLPGFQKIKPMVYSGIFPVDSSDFVNLQEALEKLTLNDSSLTYEKEKSIALGFGFRCGFLGLLHMEIVQERLERHYDLNLVVTAPTVVYKMYMMDGSHYELENPADLEDISKVERIEEPFVKIVIHTPSEYIGGILKILEDRRGNQIKMEYTSANRVIIEYRLPMNEMVLDFHDKLKSISKGYASMEYELMGFETGDLVKLDIMLNGEKVDALSTIVHKSKAYQRGKALCEKLKELIPMHQFQVAIQASIGAKIIARETIGALRKDVTAKCYGGDISRKRKLLEKQKEGKKRMKQVGAVEVPQAAFLAVLKIGE